MYIYICVYYIVIIYSYIVYIDIQAIINRYNLWAHQPGTSHFAPPAPFGPTMATRESQSTPKSRFCAGWKLHLLEKMVVQQQQQQQSEDMYIYIIVYIYNCIIYMYIYIYIHILISSYIILESSENLHIKTYGGWLGNPAPVDGLSPPRSCRISSMHNE